MNQPDFAKEYVGLTDEQLSQMKVADLVPEAQRAHAEELRRRASPEFQETRLHEEDLERARIAKLGADAAFMTTQSPWTEVAALPQTDPKAGIRKTMRGGALVWPQMCCCCGDTTGLERTRVVSQKQMGGASYRITVEVPQCQRCKAHDRRARARGTFLLVLAGLSAVAGIALSLATKGSLAALFILVTYLIAILISLRWSRRQATEAAKALLTPTCTCVSPAKPSVQVTLADGWRLRFTNAAFAEAFAAKNLGGKILTRGAGR